MLRPIYRGFLVQSAFRQKFAIETTLGKLFASILASLLLISSTLASDNSYTAEIERRINLWLVEQGQEPLYKTPRDMLDSYPATRIVGNLFDVGTVDLGVFLITSPAGHILINTGLEGSINVIARNIRDLGFTLKDVKILLIMQSHFDHAGDLQSIRELTGAEVLATKEDAVILQDGGYSDPLFGGFESFRPVNVDKFIADEDTIVLGNIELKVHFHPGHTKGSVSYSMQIEEEDKNYDVLIVNMAYINSGTRFIENPTYEQIYDDFVSTIHSQQAMSPDIWVSAHKSQYGFHEKYVRGKPYDKDTFYDPKGYLEAIKEHELRFEEHIYLERMEVLGK